MIFAPMNGADRNVQLAKINQPDLQFKNCFEMESNNKNYI